LLSLETALIIFRYLAKEVLANMFAVSLVLLLIIMSARFASYLAEAATGQLDAGVLLTLMALRMPAYLQLILPMGLFIGIMMAYGRMYVDNEMSVLSACGVSDRRLLLYTFWVSSFVAAIVALFSLYLGPESVRATETLLAEQRGRTDFETLKPARFHQLDSGRGVSYAESISDDKQRLNVVFLAELASRDEDTPPTILMADSGETIIDTEKGEKYLLLRNGRRYVGRPGEASYEVVTFKEYAQRLPKPDYNIRPKKKTDSLTTEALLQRDGVDARAALHWRLSLPFLVVIVGVLGMPMSRTEPRKGRYWKLVPAILIYMVYLVAVNSARSAYEDGKVDTVGVIWGVHAVFLIFAVFLFFMPQLKQLLHRER
jgi:lipopolysaccharide export system permease protein